MMPVTSNFASEAATNWLFMWFIIPKIRMVKVWYSNTVLIWYSLQGHMGRCPVLAAAVTRRNSSKGRVPQLQRNVVLFLHGNFQMHNTNTQGSDTSLFPSSGSCDQLFNTGYIILIRLFSSDFGALFSSTSKVNSCRETYLPGTWKPIKRMKNEEQKKGFLALPDQTAAVWGVWWEPCIKSVNVANLRPLQKEMDQLHHPLSLQDKSRYSPWSWKGGKSTQETKVQGPEASLGGTEGLAPSWNHPFLPFLTGGGWGR